MSNEKDRTKKTARAVTLRTYLSEDEVNAKLQEHDPMVCVAYLATHDKDTNDDGTPKVPHVHVNLLLDRSRELAGTLSWFKAVDESGKPVQTHIEAVLDPVGCDDYLIHATEEAIAKGKYQYDEEIIKVLKGDRDTFRDFKTDWVRKHEARVKKEASQDETEEMIDDIIAGKSFREMARRYGRDYMKNCWTYRSYCSHIVMEESGDVEKALAVEGRYQQDILSAETRKEYVHGQVDGLKFIKRVMSDIANSGNVTLADANESISKLIANLERSL